VQVDGARRRRTLGAVFCLICGRTMAVRTARRFTPGAPGTFLFSGQR
jgi:hypothetical protein